MEATIATKYETPEVPSIELTNKGIRNESDTIGAFSELEKGVYAALETYSNVHRGSGHYSLVTTHLYEQARKIVLEYLGLNKRKYTVIFCTPRRASVLTAKLNPKTFQTLSSREIGLPIGIVAVAIKKKALPKGIPFQTGGGSAKLISKKWIIWSNAPDKFESGTPAIINVIAFAKALLMVRKSGKDIFKHPKGEQLTSNKILYSDELQNFSGKELLDELRNTQIGRGISVPTMDGTRQFINFDNSASTPTFRPILNSFSQTLQQPAIIRKKIVQEVKSVCSQALNAPLADYDIIFTSNTTEAINLAAESFSRNSVTDVVPVVLNTLLEHTSNELPWRTISSGSLIRLSVNVEGFVDLKELESVLKMYNQEGKFGKKRILLVAVSGASNVLGACNDIAAIGKLAHNYGARLLVDAAQLIAHKKIDMAASGIDYLAFSAHKMYAPFGSGGLVARKGLLNFNIEETKLINSSGEENEAGIAALGKALILLQRIGMDLICEEEKVLTKQALDGLSQIPGIKIFGVKDTESASFDHKIGAIVFISDKMMSNKLAKELALQKGIGVRFGCHCAHIIVKRILNIPPALEQFQRLIQTLFPKLRLPGVLRVSIGIENTKEEIDILLETLNNLVRNGDTEANEKNIQSPLPKALVQKQVNNFIQSSTEKVYSHF